MSEGRFGVVGWAWGGLGAIVVTVVGLVAVREPVFAGVDRVTDRAIDSAVAEMVEEQASRGKGPRAPSSAGAAGGPSPGVFPNPFDSKGGGDLVLPGKDAIDAQNEMNLKLRRNDLKGALATLERLVDLDKNAAKDPKLRESVVDLTQRVTLLTGGEPERMFSLLAQKMGPVGIDILYQLVTTKGGSRAAKLAEQLLLQDDVLDRGSDAVQVAWKLRRAKGCDEKKALFSRAAKDGDGRTLGQLYLLDKPCSRRRRDPTCCLTKDPELEAAIDALKARGFQ